MSERISVVHIDRLDLSFAPKPWEFADRRRAEIDAHFAGLQRVRPALWNGRVLLTYEHALDGGVFRGAYLETDYASFLAWRDWGYPDTGMTDCFGAAAVLTSDGAFLLGIMGAHTANAGRIYFPCGTPDPRDIVDGRVDLDASVRRELIEETGLDIGEFESEGGWTAVLAMPFIMQVKLLRSRQDAASLRRWIIQNLAGDKQPEFADIRIVRSLADLDPAMPDFIQAYLRDIWK